MNTCGLYKNIVFLLLFFCIPHSSYGEMTKPFGFQFGMSNKSARELITSSGFKVLSNEVDSKDIRTVVVNGLLVESPVSLNQTPNTKLEFFNDKLMSVSMILDYLDKEGFDDTKKRLTNYLEDSYGKPSESEKILSYQLLSWNLEDTKLLLSFDERKASIKIEYSYRPIMNTKYEEDLSERRKGYRKERDPAAKMFKDGNYSKPRYSNY